jgi:hypothetical protein
MDGVWGKSSLPVWLYQREIIGVGVDLGNFSIYRQAACDRKRDIAYLNYNAYPQVSSSSFLSITVLNFQVLWREMPWRT